MLCPRVYPYYLTKLVRVSVIVTLIAALLGFSNSIYLLIFVYTFLSTAFFLVSSSAYLFSACADRHE